MLPLNGVHISSSAGVEAVCNNKVFLLITEMIESDVAYLCQASLPFIWQNLSHSLKTETGFPCSNHFLRQAINKDASVLNDGDKIHTAAP